MLKNKKISILFIDVIGLKYDGNTVYKRGLGGSESAVIFQAEELAKIGFDVTVINNCKGGDCSPGRYADVKYLDLDSCKKEPDKIRGIYFDIIIGSRTVVPFMTSRHANEQGYLGDIFVSFLMKAKLKILWMHDTFCGGDHLVEDMVQRGEIDEIFTLSDFHTNYITTSHHGPKRNFEVLKKHIFQTRNGIRIYKKDVDLKKKDPKLFVYNASISKGMKPLIAKIWPEVLKKWPLSQLVIIGGYYKWDPEREDAYEKEFKELASKGGYENITFTGIISQKEIAEILSKATFFIYPGAFPETFGISALESLAYNTPLITTRFGALEETAIDLACYHINYAIEPNSLFPHINHERQVSQFVELVNRAKKDPYLLQQKQNYCNVVKDIVTWDTVAIQWKQHFYRKLGLFLPVEEYRRVMEINSKIERIFNRRFINQESYRPFIAEETKRKIVVVTPFFNARDYIENCIRSVAQQNYNNFVHYLIDDCSTDNTSDVVREVINSLPLGLRGNFILIENIVNKGAVKNQYDTIISMGHEEDIIMLLDGDDWLVNNNEIFNFYNEIYSKDLEFTYGSCWSLGDNIPLIAQEYPEEIKKARSYRSHHFNWILPYTHLRTFKQKIIRGVREEQLQDEFGNFFKAGGDGALFYALLEAAMPERVKCLQEIVYVYNDTNPLNDYKVNAEEQNKNARKISGNAVKPERETSMKKILIAIPTAKYIEPETFLSIYNLLVPEGYTTQFQYFYGYNIEQIRNLIADWTVRGFDYLFAVDSDIAFKPDTLVKLLSHDKPLVSGMYIQRKPDCFVLELYEDNNIGGVSNIPVEKIANKGLVEIAGCGFGCVLVKKEVFKAIGYPQFVYKTAIDHKDTISEDVYFCKKAREAGFKLFVDTSIFCDHLGTFTYRLSPPVLIEDTTSEKIEFLKNLRKTVSIPRSHLDYLYKMRDEMGINPKNILDVGSCVLHWYDKAKEVWPKSKIYCFEAMKEVKEIYDGENIEYYLGVLSDRDNKEVKFYKNTEAPGGNSYYRENSDFSMMADVYYPETTAEIVKTTTLSTALGSFKDRNFIPDLLKIDVQGAELDILKGFRGELAAVRDVILELPKVEYNKGSPAKEIIIAWMETMGFFIKTELFSDNGADGDYHFQNSRFY